MSKHIKDIEIDNFKGLKELNIKDMKLINIFIGDNNLGKTTILEAISMFEKPFDYISHLRLLNRKYNFSNIKYENINQIFNNCDYDNLIRIKLKMDDDSDACLKISADEESVLIIDDENYGEFGGPIDKTALTYSFNKEKKLFFIENKPNMQLSVNKKQFKYLNIGFVSPIDTYMQQSTLSAIDTVIKNDQKKKLIKLLQLFDKNITDLNYISNKELYITTCGTGTLSISNFGDGLKKAVILISKIIDSKDGIALIDEIETSIHKDILGKIFKELVKNAREYNTQVVSTTHSLEAIKELLLNLEKDLDSIALYRLEEFKGKIYCRRFSGQKAYEIIVKEGGDLR